MQIVEAGIPFSFSYAAFDQTTGLFVQASIYDITSGSAVFVTKVNMAHVSSGMYSGNYTGSSGKTYLVIAIVYTDSGYTTVDTTRAIASDCYQDSSGSCSKAFYDYAAFDQVTNLFVAGSVYNVSSGSPVFVSTTAMTHVILGVYFGSFSMSASGTYEVIEAVYTDSGFTTLDTTRAPGSDAFQAFSIGGNSADPGIANVKLGTAYNINGTDLVGTYNPFSVTVIPGLDAPDAALDGLVAYLTAGIPALTVLTEWPYANQKLTYPSVTVTQGKQKRMPEMPYEVSRTTPNGSNQTTVNEVVANYDMVFQLDLWARNKKERRVYLDAILALFNAQEVDSSGLNKPDGISLQLSGYFDEWARYEIDTHECLDDEQAAQRQERRERIAVIVNIREIRQRTYYAMITTQIKSQTLYTSDALTDDASNTESYTVPAS